MLKNSFDEEYDINYLYYSYSILADSYHVVVVLKIHRIYLTNVLNVVINNLFNFILSHFLQLFSLFHLEVNSTYSCEYLNYKICSNTIPAKTFVSFFII